MRDKGEAGEHTGVGQAGMRPRPSPCAAREVLESSDPSRGWSVGIKVRSRAAGQKEPLISWGWGGAGEEEEEARLRVSRKKSSE